MEWQVMTDILHFIDIAEITEVDITGGAPETHPHLIEFVQELRRRPFITKILLRTNLTIYADEVYRYLPETLYGLNVDLVASMPCYLEDNIDRQRGKGVFGKNIEVLRHLNQIGFGTGMAGRRLHLVYNPGGAYLPGAQEQLEKAYKAHLAALYGISFDRLYTITNMPLGRFAKQLKAQGKLDDYVELLMNSSHAANLSGLMCRYTVSVDWRGHIYDCDFNQALGKPAAAREIYIGRINPQDLAGLPVVTGDHCFGCTAGAGSGCRGSFVSQTA
jgi:radical SAM/Cys-rich protein